MDREETKAMIGNIRSQILEQTRAMVEKRHIHGEPMEVEINGKPHKMLRYPSAEKNAPVYFDIHGGGFAWGMMEEGDLLCHQINEQLGFEAYALDYPLAPDAAYPDALNWLYETISHIRQHADAFNIDAGRMVIGGRSAGGNLATALCLLASERGQFQFFAQVLDHPYLDLCGIIPKEERYDGEGALAPEFMGMIAAAYATEDERREAHCSPLNADSAQLRELPQAVIQTCEYDSLRPDGDRYALRLREAGVKVISHCYPKAAHSFTEVEGPEERNGQQWLIDAIKRLMQGADTK